VNQRLVRETCHRFLTTLVGHAQSVRDECVEQCTLGRPGANSVSGA